MKRRKLTVLLLCSAATESPKEITSITKIRASNNVEAIAQTNGKKKTDKAEKEKVSQSVRENQKTRNKLMG